MLSSFLVLVFANSLLLEARAVKKDPNSRINLAHQGSGPGQAHKGGDFDS